MAHEPVYTWTFSERSLMMKFFLWLYEADRKQLTFCKLFWGMIAVPITLPIRLGWELLKLLAAMGYWPYETLGDSVKKRSKQRRALHRERWEAWKKEADPFFFHITGDVVFVTFCNEVDKDTKATIARYGQGGITWIPEHRFNIWDRVPKSFDWIEPEPKPPKVNAPSRIAEGMSSLADRTMAWFQAHPGIGQGINNVATVVGRGLVYFVFYPLMFLVPAASISFAFYEVWIHREGPINGFHQAWSAGINSLHLAVDKAWIIALVTLGMGIFMIGLGIFTWWALLAAEKLEAPPKGSRLYYAVGANRPPSRIGVITGNALATGGSWLGYGIWYLALIVTSPIWLFVKYGAKPTGRSLKRTGQFFVLGHHSIKNRTCPRIEVVKELSK